MSVKAGKSDRMKASAYDARYDTIQLRANANHLWKMILYIIKFHIENWNFTN